MITCASTGAAHIGTHIAASGFIEVLVDCMATFGTAGSSRFFVADRSILCKYVVRNGKVIYHKKVRVFRISLSKLKGRKGN